MGKNILFLFLIILSFGSAQAAALKCDYGFSGAPMGSVKIWLDENGIPGDSAEVTLFFTSAKKMPLSNEVPQGNEALRLYIAKGDSNNELLMIVRRPENNVIKSVLINNALNGGFKELTGICQGL